MFFSFGETSQSHFMRDADVRAYQRRTVALCNQEHTYTGTRTHTCTCRRNQFSLVCLLLNCAQPSLARFVQQQRADGVYGAACKTHSRMTAA